MQKVLEIRCYFPSDVSTERLNELGEDFQLSLPADFQAELGIEPNDITFEVKEPPVFLSACGREYEDETDRDRHEGQCEKCIDRNHGR